MGEPEAQYADPLIDEVRQRRRELFAACGNDLNKLFELIQRIQARHPEKLTDLRKLRSTDRSVR